MFLKRARRRGVRVMGDLELASWYLQGEIIGITGCERQNHYHGTHGPHPEAQRHSGAGGREHRHAAGGDGEDFARRTVERAGTLSFQLETTQTFRAHIGAALNVTPDHLDHHGTLERYADAKGRLFL